MRFSISNLRELDIDTRADFAYALIVLILLVATVALWALRRRRSRHANAYDRISIGTSADAPSDVRTSDL